MLSLPPTVRVFVATGPADLRRSLDGLSALVREGMRGNPLSGHLFVFHNRRRNRSKVLYWDRSGMCVWYKRLERGRFHFPTSAEPALEIEWTDLQLLLEGIDLAGARRRKRFEPAPR